MHAKTRTIRNGAFAALLAAYAISGNAVLADPSLSDCYPIACVGSSITVQNCSESSTNDVYQFCMGHCYGNVANISMPLNNDPGVGYVECTCGGDSHGC